MMNKGIPFIVSGPSGSGKDTLLKRLFAQHKEIMFSYSCVTRAKRGTPGEDEKYRFVSVEQFKEMLENNELLEYNIYLGNYYGTPKKPVEDATESGNDIILEIDVNGARQIRQSLPEAVSIFIMPPSMEVLKKRLLGRSTESAEVAEKRLGEAVREIGCAEEYDYIVVNDDLDQAVNTLYSIILAEKSKTSNMRNFINEVQNNA